MSGIATLGGWRAVVNGSRPVQQVNEADRLRFNGPILLTRLITSLQLNKSDYVPGYGRFGPVPVWMV